MLLTGDIPADEEKIILGELPECDILKVAHHGSDSSTSEELLEKVHPRAALISCGKNNRYGHPGKETMKRLEKEECEIWRTDIEGALTVTIKEDSWTGQGFR